MQILLKTARLLGAFLLISALILCASGCTAQRFDRITINSIKESEGTVYSSRMYGNKNTVKLASTESAALYFDKDSGGISLASEYTGKKWTSLPYFENSFAASFIVKVTDGETVYTLDSSAGVNSDKPTVEKTADGAVVTYVLKWDSLRISLPVELSLRGAALNVSVDMSGLVTLSDGLTVLSISMLPFFGAVRYTPAESSAAAGDYFLVPDGPGALMYTAVQDENTALTFSVYGKDYYEENIPASVGAYGIVQNGTGLAVTLTEGEENALIRVIRACYDGKNLNRIYPEFIITPVSGEKGQINIGKSYSGKISATYEVLSSGNAAYTDIAASVRQALIGAGLLSAEKCEDEYPLTLSVVAGTDGKRKNITAGYQQLENLLSILKAKGINEINAVLSGAFSGGLTASAENTLRLERGLGNKNDLRSLSDFVQAQNFNIFAEINLLSSKSSLYCNKGVSGEYGYSEIGNPLSPYIGKSSYSVKSLGLKGVSEGANNILHFAEKNSFSGVALADTYASCREEAGTGDGMYSSYSNGLNDVLGAISSKEKLMLAGAPMNIIKNADYLYNVSFDTAAAQTEAYTAVPFIPAVVHGSTVYAGKPVNSSSVSVINLLKAVEFGAVPHYVWTFSKDSDKYYELTLNEAVEFCIRARNELRDLISERIIGHGRLADGVFCTAYEGGARVYVNYNNYSVIMGDISVMPYDYLRIG